MREISVDDALRGQDSIFQVRAGEAGVYWLASIAEQDGRVTVRHWHDGEIEDLTPTASVRSRVMEYGGGAYDAAAGLVAYCDDLTRRLWLLEGDAARPITPESQRFRYGGLHLVAEQRLLIAVREDHGVKPEERTEIVALELDSENLDGGRVLVTGADFYAGPSVQGGRLAWYQWQHPNMSWDQAEVFVAPLSELASASRIAGGPGISAQHPIWFSDGRLALASDESGYWNWRIADLTAVDKQPAPVATWNTDHDCDTPTWVLDAPAACAVNPDLLASTEIIDGIGQLALWQPSTGEVKYPLPGTAWIESVAARDGEIFVIANWPDRPSSLVRLDQTGQHTELVNGLSLPDPITPSTRWATGQAGPVQSFFYQVPGKQTPPLHVLTHGGPTSATEASYNRQIQFWVSRGFAVLDVNYSGSTGFGRAYRDRLKGQWGILDVQDVVAAVKDLIENGLVDPNRVAISGGSAGGYTTLQALVSTNIFAAGMSSYGIGELKTLATDTHKAESRYLDGLIGPWPEAEQLYQDRSPINQLEKLSTPMLILQGLADKVVPPNQAYAMAAAVRAKNLPLALLTFEQEGHGFRSMAARKAALEAKLSFLQQVFSLPHSPDIPQLEIENL